MDQFKKDLDKYQKDIYRLITKRLTAFQEKYEPFNKENGTRYMNKVIELMMKVSLYPKMRAFYCEFGHDHKILIETLNEMMDDYAKKLQDNYVPGYDHKRPLWKNSVNVDSLLRTKEINSKIDEFIKDLTVKMGQKNQEFIDNHECSEERNNLFIEANELFELYFIPIFIYRAAKADGINRNGLTKYIKENIFWKGRANEIAAVIKMAESSEAA